MCHILCWSQQLTIDHLIKKEYFAILILHSNKIKILAQTLVKLVEKSPMQYLLIENYKLYCVLYIYITMWLYLHKISLNNSFSRLITFLQESNNYIHAEFSLIYLVFLSFFWNEKRAKSLLDPNTFRQL